MTRVRVTVRPPRAGTPAPIDTRTPSGRTLPYALGAIVTPSSAYAHGHTEWPCLACGD